MAVKKQTDGIRDQTSEFAPEVYGPREPTAGAASVIIPGGANADFLVTAKDAGAAGNAIKIVFTNPAGSHTLAVTVSKKTITIRLAGTGIAVSSTAQEVADAINASPAASALIVAPSSWEAPAGTGVMANAGTYANPIVLSGGQDAVNPIPPRTYIDSSGGTAWFSDGASWTQLANV